MNIFKSTPPGKKIKEILGELDTSYSIRIIDGENCIYRRLNNNYDIEVSGLDNRKKAFHCTIYVWSLKDGIKITNTYHDINSFEHFVETLKLIEKDYG